MQSALAKNHRIVIKKVDGARRGHFLTGIISTPYEASPAKSDMVAKALAQRLLIIPNDCWQSGLANRFPPIFFKAMVVFGYKLFHKSRQWKI